MNRCIGKLLLHQGFFFVSLVVVLISLGVMGAQGWAAESYPAKDITFIVPVNPGGGLDTYGRIAATHLQKNLPNKVNVVVTNMPGAEHAMAINTLSRAKPDGYTIGVFSIPGNCLNQVLGRAGGYDLRKITWLGNVSTVPQLLTVSAKSPYKSVDDLRKAGQQKPLNVPHPGFTTVTGAANVIAAVRMDLKTNFIPQNSAADTVLALLRGDGDFITSVPVTVKGQLASGEVRPLIVLSDKRLPSLPNVPTCIEIGYPELVSAFRVYYLIGATPGLPEDVAKVLRDTFKKAMDTPEAQEAVRKTGEEPDYRDHLGAAKIIEDSIQLYEKYQKDLLVYIK